MSVEQYPLNTGRKKLFVLKNKLQPIRLAEIKWAHISLALVGLMWVFPFLHSNHQNPVTSFDQEWWSAILGLFALSILVSRNFWEKPEIPRIIQLPLALVGIVLLQLVLSKIAYFGQALMYAMYFLFVALLMVLGAKLRDHIGIEKMSQVLATFLLIGASINAVFGVIQHFHWHSQLDTVIVRKVSSLVYGNIAQHNHFANYITLGLISLGLLFQQGKAEIYIVAILATLFLFVLTLSGSKSAWLYLMMISGLSWWGSRSDPSLRPLLKYGLSLIAGLALMHLVVQLPFINEADSTNTLQRFTTILNNDAGASSTVWMKFYMWREALIMLMQSPWLGVGLGQFAWHHVQLLPELRANYIFGFYNNAHNILFELAAETGIGGLLVFLGTLGYWLYGLQRITLNASRWWGFSILGVLAIHSLLEYPLWYMYFLAVAAILLGALDEKRFNLKLQNIGRFIMTLILLAGFISLIQLKSGFQQLKDTLALRSTTENFPLIRDGLAAVYDKKLLTPYAEMYILLYTEVNEDHIKQKLALGSSVMHFRPVDWVLYRQAYFLAQDGQLAQAKLLLEKAIWSYPNNSDAHQLLTKLAGKDPAHFSALLEFAAQKEQEHDRAVRQ